MIRTFLEFELADGKAADFAAFFEREAILSTAVAQDGCLSAELTLAADETVAVVTALWDDQAAYDRWTSRSDRADLTEELNTHLRSPLNEHSIGKVYRVASRFETD